MDFTFIVLIASLIGGSVWYGVYYFFSLKAGWMIAGLIVGFLYGALAFDITLILLRPTGYYEHKFTPFASLFFNPIVRGIVALLYTILVIGTTYFASQYGEGIRMMIFWILPTLAFIGLYKFLDWGVSLTMNNLGASRLDSPTQSRPTSESNSQQSSSPPPNATIFGVKDDD